MTSTIIRRAGIISVYLILFAVLSGCNEEKAQALLTAANSFRAEGTKAIDAYEELFVSSIKQFDVSSETEVTRAKKALEDQYKANGGNFIDLKTVLALAGVKTGPTAEDVVKGEYADVRLLLNNFAGALTNLPDASYFVDDNTIACTNEVAARLAKKFADIGVRIKANPVAMRARQGQLTGMINKALKASDGERLIVLVSQLKDVERQGQELNAKAMLQSLVAAKAGVQVVRAARNFQTLNVADILVILGKALEIANDSNAFNTVELGNRLTALKTELENDDYWKLILATKLNETGSACAPVHQKK